MTERQYMLQHILHLSSKLSTTADPQQKKNIEEALLFYSRELRRIDEKAQKQQYTQ